MPQMTCSTATTMRYGHLILFELVRELVLVLVLHSESVTSARLPVQWPTDRRKFSYKYFNDLARQAHSSKISLRHTALEGLCPPRDPPTCMPASARYRTHDGTCNSKRRPRWGAAQMPFNRFLPPEYGDGVDSIRLSVEGGALASSRFVSLLVHGARDGEAVVTLMTAQWGQLLDHDMTSTAQPRSINGSVPSCCGNTDFHPSCFPIKVPLDDPWLAPLKVRCLEFLRSAPAQRRDCVLSWREQTSQATSYIDASPIYSNSVKSSDNARVFRNGLLVYGRGNPAEDVCHRGAIATQCIRAGDGRSGEQPGLLALHHVWVGEHNRIAMELSEMNLHWSDEKIYQETRRIIGAMFQHITYREFLPIVLGREVCRLFDLELLSSGFYQGYDPKTNPTVANSFAAAAFRFGHSLVQNSYMRCDRFHNFMRNNVSLHEEFQRGDIGSPGSLHRLLRGLVNQRALKRDEFITPELTNHLFQTPGFPFGLDLAAINIQRGRDHGVPPYTSWRVPCGLTPINSWEDFANVVGPQSAQRISHAYRSVHDIDLFVGGIAERPVVGGLVGPTFACIIAQQFSNSRKGDRFWYENGGFENSFTPAQLQSIRQVSLAQVLCRTVGGGTMQPHVFLPTDIEGNERQVCGTGALALLDLSPWIEQDPFATVTTNTAHEPDRVFEIITTNKMTETAPTVSLQVVKENKAGFSNRIRPTDHTNLVATGINSFVTGVQVPGEVIHISDKLDIRQKVSPAKRPTVTAKPIKGVNNKLDKNPSRRPQSTRRTTAVVNNIPIELRSVGTDETGPNIIETKSKGISITNALSTTESMTVDKIEARIDDTDQEVGLLRLNDLPSTEQEEKHLDEQPNENLTANIPTISTALEQTGTINENNYTKEGSKETDLKRQSKFEVDEQDAILATYTERTTSYPNTERDLTRFDGDLTSKIDNKISELNSDSNPKDVIKNSSTNEETILSNITLIKQGPTDSNDTQDTAEITYMDLTTDTHENHADDNLTLNDNKRTTFEATLLFKILDQELKTKEETISRKNQTETLTKPNQTDECLEAKSLSSNKNFHTNENRQSATNINQFTELELNEEPKRLERRGPDANRKLIVVKVPNWHNETKSRFHAKPTKSASLKKSTTVTSLANLSTRPTSRQFELRQYKTQPTFYTRPQKVVVNGPNADQYEIEINIRQTNKQSSSALPITAPTNSYTNYYTSYKPFGFDRYSPSYVGTYRSSTIPPHPFYPNTPAASLNVVQTRRTKPPTVIYINEHEDRYTTTTRTPGIFQNFITFASSDFANSNKPKQPSPHSTSVQKERPSYGAVVSSVHENSHIYAPNTEASAISHYIPRPSAQNPSPAYPAVPSAISLSQVGGVVSSGVVQATSSAISAGNFGTITGVAQANGGDSTFSFNIRPKPNVVGQPQLPLPPNQIDAGSYGLLSSNRPGYGQLPNPGFLSSQHSAAASNGHTHFGNSQKESANSPFSSENKKPQLGNYGYYSQLQNLPLEKKTNLEHIVTVNDYDEYAISRTLEPIVTKNTTNGVSNGTETSYDIDDEREDTDDYDYVDDILGMGEKFDSDGYIRPEHMIDALIKSKENELKNLTAHRNNTTKPLDDNYVLPVLNTTTETLKLNNTAETLERSTDRNTTRTFNPTTQALIENVTPFTDVEGKNLNNDILAEDYDDMTTETLIATKTNIIETIATDKQVLKSTEIERRKAVSKFAAPVAFAPIKILTKLERPDNWVIYDSPKNYPLLPELPAMNEYSSAPTDEVPMPIKGLASIWLKKIKRQKDKNRAQFLVTDVPADNEARMQNEEFVKFNSEDFTTPSPANMAVGKA